jgi:hypothetical protein
MITLPSDAIQLLGGHAVVAARIGRPYTTVASWSARQGIPAHFWPALVDMASERDIEGFTYKALAMAHFNAVRQGRAA